MKEKKEERTSEDRFETIKQIFPVYDQLPVWLGILLFAGLVALFFGANESFVGLPDAKYKDQEDSKTFIAERAYEHVRHLSQFIGPRFQGTYNSEVLAVNFLKTVIEGIAEMSHPNVIVELDHQIADGGYIREGKPGESDYPVINVFRGLQNIVAKVYTKETDDYILLNSHFDTFPGSPGAGDDGSMVGVMLELMRIISKQDEIKNPIVFLFNGCEENSLQGSAAFIASHRWWNKTSVVLNLETAGNGGKEMLFQTSSEHPWLMREYWKSVPSAYASAIGEELFEAGLIPSDTDFRNFRRFGDKLAGMDFAQLLEGPVYHTKGDAFNRVDIKALQHTGNNMLALIDAIQNSKEINNVSEFADAGKAVVFYDFLGLFLVFYNQFISESINAIVFSALTIIIGWCVYSMSETQGIRLSLAILEWVIALAIQIVSIVLAMGFLIFIAFLMDVANRTMTYYSNVWIIFGLFFCPFMFMLCLLPYVYIKWRERSSVISNSYYVQLQIYAFSQIMTILLIMLTGMGIRSAYLFVIGPLFYLFTLALNLAFNFINKGNKWLYLHIAGQIIPTLYYMYLTCIAFNTLIPSVTRSYSGGDSNPDYMIGFLAGLTGYLAIGFYAPLINLFKHRKFLLGIFLALFIIFVIVIMTPLGFPYRELDSPQRWMIWHAKRTFHRPDGSIRKGDSGYYLMTFDRHGVSSVENYVPEIKVGSSVIDECNTEVFCGIPFYLPGYHGNHKYGVWIPATPPNFPQAPQLELLSREQLTPTQTRYNFRMSGPDHMNLHISPLEEAKIIDWSFLDLVPEAKTRWNDRDFHFINYFHGGSDNSYVDYEFYIVFEVPANWSRPYTFDIAFVAQYTEKPELHSEDFKMFLSKYPKWTNVIAWPSCYEAYQII